MIVIPTANPWAKEEIDGLERARCVVAGYLCLWRNKLECPECARDGSGSCKRIAFNVLRAAGINMPPARIRALTLPS